MKKNYIFPRWFSIILTNMAAFMLGCYAIITYRFGLVVPTWNWIFVGIVGVLFFIDANAKR